MPNTPKPKTSVPTRRYMILFLIGAVLTICLIIFFVQMSNRSVDESASNNSQTDTQDDDFDETAEADYTAFQAIDSQDVLDFIDHQNTGFLYIGRPTCPHCQVFAPILTKVVKQNDYTVFYYDTDAAKNDADLKSAALSALDVTSVPTFMYIKNGIVTAMLENTESEAALKEFITKNQ